MTKMSGNVIVMMKHEGVCCVARAIKRSKTKSEQVIETVWRGTKKGTDIQTQAEKEVIFAIDGTLFFLDVYDHTKGTKHKNFFKKRYLSLHNKMTQTEISSKLNICRETIGDYCSMYIYVFEKCLAIARKISAHDPFELKSDRKLLERATKFLVFDD
jgi:hypothetical protein